MKLAVLLFSLCFSILSFAQNKNIYLVTTHDPHILADLYPVVDIVKSEGRTLLVTGKANKKIPSSLSKYLKQVNPTEVLNFVPTFKMSKAPNEEIIKLIENIQADEMRALVEKITSFSNRKSGSSDNKAASDWIESEFKKMGLTTDTDCFKRKTCNVYGKLTGTTNPEEIILVEAHLDSVGHRNAGADDNGSGIAGLLMIAKKVISFNPKKSFIFFATNGEEQGLLGAKHYVKKLAQEGELGQIKFVINMDMIGYNNTDSKIDLETNNEFLETANWMADVVNTYTTLTPNIVTPAWGSDHVPFLKKNIPTILTIEHWPSKTPCYHSACDKADHLTYDYAVEIIKLNVAASYLKSEE